MLSSPLNGTRYFVRKRALLIAILMLLVLLSIVISFRLNSASTPSQNHANESLPIAAAADLSVFSRDQKYSSNESAIYRISDATLLELVNMSDIEFIPSSGDVPYYVVVSSASGERGKVLGLVYLTTDVASDEWTYGYNSRLQVLVFVNGTGTMRSLMVWQMQESWGYMITDTWVNTLVNRTVYEPLQVGQDFDGIAGATISSKAIASGVREAGRIVVDDYRSRQITKTESNPTTSNTESNTSTLTSLARIVQTNDLTITGMFVLAVVAFRRNDERLKYVTLGVAVLSIGVYIGRMVSIVDVTMFISLSLPPLSSNLYWYLLYAWTVATSFIWGRVYCGYLCPFGAFTQIVNRISPLRRRVPIRIHSKMVYLKYAILAMVVIGVVTGNSWIMGMEPFETFFFLKGDWWMWAVMISALVLSVPFSRPFCHYVCPVGAILSVLGRARVMEIRRWPECDACKVCERTCPEGAIVGARISVLECLNCRECENNYLDARRCPHYRSRVLPSQRENPRPVSVE